MSNEPPAITVTVTRSAGPDGAVLVMIDTEFEPNGSDGGPGLRVLVNDDPVFEGKAYEPVADGQDLPTPAEAPDRRLDVRLDEITRR